MKVLVTGASGMLGLEVSRAAVKRLGKRNVVGLTHYDMDITNPDMVGATLDRHKPDVLINCAGLVKGREATEKAFMWVNAQAPWALAQSCDLRGVQLIQVSTDCVFKNDGPHDESALPNATDTYGLSKMKGEIPWGRHMNLRMSFVGLGRRGLLAWLLRQKGSVEGFRQVRWNGLTTMYAAQRILDCLGVESIRTYHIHGRDTTKYDLLVAANEAFGLGLEVKPVDEPVSDMRLRSIYAEPEMPTIRQQLDELVSARWRH